MQKYRVIGMMSGTSVDGLDIAYCEFKTDDWNSFDFDILNSKTIPYPEDLKSQLINSITLDAQSLLGLDNRLGNWMGTELNDFIKQNKIEKCVVASHGHTVFHQPQKGFTLQIGNGQKMHQVTGFPIVYDFRTLDIAYGGQGAPLVPIGDQLLFGRFEFCLNIGGFANVSFDDGTRKAFDIGAVNIVLNELTSLLNIPYDEDGKIARGGSEIPDLQKALDRIKFYLLPFPKSIGKEWVEESVMSIIRPFQNNFRIEDIITTYTIHIGKIIAQTINRLSSQKGSMLVTGGGAHNGFLLEIIQEYCHLIIEKPDRKLINFKEAAVFGLMGLLRSNHRVNCLKSVTGAKEDTSGGIIIGQLIQGAAK